MSVRSSLNRAQAAKDAYESSTEQRAEIAHQAADDARSTAPILTGAYRDGMSVIVDGSHVMIVDNDPDAIYKEYGTSSRPAHLTLTSAAATYGRYTGWGRN
ncbi:hypothetical protein [Gordonia sp. NB41Y]|uniref:hypothetical protein n=1 Tax=Gordonia sp. NB41Y TaxID=875808 RepID=UPI0006B1EFBB|nr:hypothetical protein [Gordonia sp. NB41Y]WLP91320.1 HK97 gp10 family phage protein [Gordonia sp. NB41Y]